jgi:hypothetical protein
VARTPIPPAEKLRRELESSSGRKRSERGAQHSFYGRVRHALGYNPPVAPRYNRNQYPPVNNNMPSNAPYVFVPVPAPTYPPGASSCAPTIAAMQLLHNDELHNAGELSRTLHAIRNQAVGAAYLQIEDYHRRKKEHAGYKAKCDDYLVQRGKLERYEQQQQQRLERIQQSKKAAANANQTVSTPINAVDLGAALEYVPIPEHPGPEPAPVPRLTAWQRYRHRQLELCQKRTTNGGVIFSGGNALDRRVVVTGGDQRQKQLEEMEAAALAARGGNGRGAPGTPKGGPGTPSAGKVRRIGKGNKSKAAVAKAAQLAAVQKQQSQEHVTSSIRSLLDDAVVNTPIDERMEVSLVLYLYQSGYSINSETHNFRTYSRDSEEFLRSIDLGFIPSLSSEFRQQAKCKYYQGCIIADIYDYRKLNVNMNSPVVTRTLLRPHNETVIGDIERMLTHDPSSSSPLSPSSSYSSSSAAGASGKSGRTTPTSRSKNGTGKTATGKKLSAKKQQQLLQQQQMLALEITDPAELRRRTDMYKRYQSLVPAQRREVRLGVEREVLLATRPRLHLDPSPKVHQMLNMLQYSGSIQPTSFISNGKQSMSGRTSKRHAEALELEREAARVKAWEAEERNWRQAIGNNSAATAQGGTSDVNNTVATTAATAKSADSTPQQQQQQQQTATGLTPTPLGGVTASLPEEPKKPSFRMGQFGPLPASGKAAMDVSFAADVEQEEGAVRYDDGFLSIASFMANSREDLTKAMHHRLIHNVLFRRTIFNPRPISHQESSSPETHTPRQLPPHILSDSEQRMARAKLGILGKASEARQPGVPRVTINTNFQTMPPRMHKIPIDSVAPSSYMLYQFQTKEPQTVLTHDLIVYARPTHKALPGSQISPEHNRQYDAGIRISTDYDPKPPMVYVPLGNTSSKRAFVREYRKISLREGRTQQPLVNNNIMNK